MREALYRGRLLSTNRVVYGALVCFGGHAVIYSTSPRDGTLVGFEVDPETVGQSIGLRDRFGQEIFEGDTLKVRDALSGREFFGVVDFDDASFRITNELGGNYRWMDYICEVVPHVQADPGVKSPA